MISIASIPKEESRKRFAALPPEVQDALLSEETTAVIHETARKYKLHVDQEDVLYKAFTYTVEGFIPHADFVGVLQADAGIPQEAAKAIVDELNMKIMDRMRIALHEAYDKARQEEFTPASEAKESGLDPTEIGSLPADWKAKIAGGAGAAMLQKELGDAASGQPPAAYPADPYHEPVPEAESKPRNEGVA